MKSTVVDALKHCSIYIFDMAYYRFVCLPFLSFYPLLFFANTIAISNIDGIAYEPIKIHRVDLCYNVTIIVFWNILLSSWY